MLIKSELEIEAGRRVNSNKLEEELKALAPDIGWAWVHGDDKEIVAIRFEFPEAAGIKAKDVAQIIADHRVSAEEQTDAEYAAAVMSQKQKEEEDRQYAADRFKDLEARVTALEKGAR